jgi:SAM-dependent methyltransferase
MSACAFDDLANTYDATFTDTLVGRALREIVWARLRATFGPAQRILELGCGTGEDAVCLAGLGARVVATDPSQAMIRVAERKAASRSYAGQIEFHCLRMEAVAASLEGELFDGVLSNFGAVNCAQDLPGLVRQIADRLAPGAPLLWVVMGRYAPWEWLWYSVRGQWAKALRRLRRNGVEWRGLTVSYPSPGQLAKLLQPFFAIKRIAPLGVVLPPSYAAGWLARWPRVARMLTRLEWRAQRSSTLAWWSDHYIVEASRLGAPP